MEALLGSVRYHSVAMASQSGNGHQVTAVGGSVKVSVVDSSAIVRMKQ